MNGLLPRAAASDTEKKGPLCSRRAREDVPYAPDGPVTLMKHYKGQHWWCSMDAIGGTSWSNESAEDGCELEEGYRGGWLDIAEGDNMDWRWGSDGNEYLAIAEKRSC